jgi:hypothetical protein
MKWVPLDIEMYINAKEFVDTAVVALHPVSFGDEMKQSASMHDFITLLTNQLERQFTGRMVLFPAYSYLKKGRMDKPLEELLEWEKSLKENEFKHIFYITSDSDWRMHESSLTGAVLWMPLLPLESMDESQKVSLIGSQVKQLQNLFTQKWRENE